MSTPEIKLLVIEDNEADLEILYYSLAQICPTIHIDHASCLRDGLVLAKATAYFAVLLDLGLPDAWGIRAVERFYEAAPNIPIFVLSGASSPEKAAQTLAAGAVGYIEKGEFERSQFCAIIKKQLGSAV